MKATLKQLKAAGKEINVLFANDAIDVKGDETSLVTQLKEAIELLTDDDELSAETKLVIDEIEESMKKPAAKKAKAAPVVEEEVEEVDEDPEVESLEDQIEACKKLEDLKELVEEDDTFKKLRKSLDKFKKMAILKQAMLDILEEEEPAAPAAKPAKPAKTEKVVDPNAPKKKNPFIKEPGVLSFQETADKLLADEADEKTIQATFLKLYKERKDITDADFVKGRAAIYMKIAGKGKK